MGEVETLLREEFERQGLPDYMWEAVRNYAIDHRRPGDFLRALLRNDAAEAIVKADGANYPLLRPWMWFFRYGMPTGSYGSVALFNAWIKR